MNIIQTEDVKDFAKSFELADSLKGGRFLITGATGLIGSTLVHCLIALNKDIDITCPIRNMQKAFVMYDDREVKQLHFVECDLVNYLNNLSDEQFQYIIHCASPTVGKYMVEHPTETYMLAVDSTKAVLEYATKHDNCKVVYVSSLEYYGQIFSDDIITENMQGYVANTDLRSSYPLGKRAAEFLCSAYAKQYGVKVKIARLTQIFGAGISPDDNRVFAQFAKSIMKGTDIVLHTTGESAKPYCYTTDCISALLYILIKGIDGEAYNVANQETYISIYEMAELLRDKFNPEINVRVELHPEMGYAPVTKLRLSSEKLMSLGWRPKYNLKEMYNRLIQSLRSNG